MVKVALLGNLKSVGHKSDGDTYCDWCHWHNHQSIDTRTGEHINKSCGDHHYYHQCKILRRILKALGVLLSLKLRSKTIS